MRSGRLLSGSTLAVTLALACCYSSAQADVFKTIPLNGALQSTLSWYTTAAGQTPTTITGDGSNNGTGPVIVDDLTQNGASTYTFQNTFTAPNASFAASSQINGQSYGFVDTFVIDLPASMANAYVFSLNLFSSLGLDNLTARLYAYQANGVINLTVGSTGSMPGTIDDWSASSNGSVSSTQLPVTDLAAGEYVLQLAGLLKSGASSGTYSGQFDVTPVPLPAALPLLLIGLGVLGAGARRGRA